jgi:hypothetical protein
VVVAVVVVVVVVVVMMMMMMMMIGMMNHFTEKEVEMILYHLTLLNGQSNC